MKRLTDLAVNTTISNAFTTKLNIAIEGASVQLIGTVYL